MSMSLTAANVPQNSEAWDLLQLLADPAKLKAAMAAIKAEADAADAKIALAGEADQIVSLKAKAQNALDTAKSTQAQADKIAADTVAEALKTASGIATTAQADADAMLADASAKQKAAADVLARAHATATDTIDAANQLRSEAQALKAEADADGAAAADALAQAQKSKANADALAAKYKKAMDAMSAAVA